MKANSFLSAMGSLFFYIDGDEVVIYSSITGDTHLVDLETAKVLKKLNLDSMKYSDFLVYLADQHACIIDSELESYSKVLIEELKSLDLIDIN
mgnify:CR=1 FL=1